MSALGLAQSAPPVGWPAQREPLRVVHLSTADGRGGAAIAAVRLHRGLVAAGVRSRMLVAQRFGDDSATAEYNALAPAPAPFGRLFFRLGRRFHRPSQNRAGAFFSPEWTLTGWRLLSALPAADIVNLHWVSDFLPYRTLPAMASRARLVWTLHDMNPFTGGCHYAGSCRRFTGRCGSCPQLRTSRGENDLTRGVFRRKSRIFGQIEPSRLTIVCPSAWLAGEARRSALFSRWEVRTIPYGLDTEEFRPMDRTEARARLGLPTNHRILLFLAESIEDERKGLRYLLDAIETIRRLPGVLVVTLGRGGVARPDDPLFRHLGCFHDSEQLRAAYNAADVFACPSLQDNSPNTVLEAMACGIPVAAFASGGISELVGDGETGLLAPTGDGPALGAILHRLLDDEGLRAAMSARARLRIERQHSLLVQAERYASLYAELCRSRPLRS